MSNLEEFCTTNELARALGVQAATARRSLCVNGHYLGIVPIKLTNNRLLWPKREIRRVRGELGQNGKNDLQTENVHPLSQS